LIDSEPQTITYQSANTDFMYSAAGLEANILLQLSKGNHTKAELKLPDWQPSTDLTDDQKISGRLDVALADLTLLPLFIPDIADPTGRLSVNIDLAGSYGKPLLQGDAHLDNGSCTLPRFGLTLQDISIVGQTKDQDTLQLQGSARSGKGKTQVKGKVVVTSLKDWQAELKLTGDHFEILNLPQAQILVSPDLNLVATPGELLVDGKITIPEAEVEYIRIPETVTISPDVIIVDQPDVTIEQRLNVFTQVQLILGDKIRVRGYGFESGLNGQLMLINDPPAPLSIWGDVNIEDGNYRAYGQDLTIEQGRLMFAGSALNNPGIDLRAARIKGDITAGIHATGRLTSPELTLYSQPPMDQADILAYIVIGQPLGQAKTEQGDVLYSAASSIGLAGGELLSKNIGKRFDIEEVRIETGTEVEEATLIIGTQVSSRLYVRYAYELWNNINTLLTRYKLDRHWYLETETGVESSADFKYTIEK
jgi:translocation and assembly module TamB